MRIFGITAPCSLGARDIGRSSAGAAAGSGRSKIANRVMTTIPIATPATAGR